MNLQQPWHLVFLVGFVIFFGIRHVFIKRTKDQRKVVSEMDGLEKFLLFLMIPTTFLLPLLFLFTLVLSFADYQLLGLVQGLGAATMLVSLWLFWRSHTDLGMNWSVSLELHEGHELISHGVYRSVRHPMYASIWLWGIAQGLLLENWLAGWAVLPAFAAMYFLRLPREERLMRDSFGDAYRDYANRTGRLIPRLWSSDAD